MDDEAQSRCTRVGLGNCVTNHVPRPIVSLSRTIAESTGSKGAAPDTRFV